ncbi:MAG TPA: adenylate/guanylate cyclase domain-containing protein [Methylibium sp.]|nr:adenylate/guanylate cyclase domain-containing protein [Methylibium sp.]
MIRCPSCQEENPPKFRLCGYCGAALAPAAPALPVREIRRTVTLLFSDLKGSTALGERIDSEALHEVKERYFGAMAAQITRHGGKIEKYIGDAIMAVFGIPVAHEDDALRAVRAAAGMQAELRRVNADLQARYGVTLGNRTGINTGEVVANDDPKADQKLATGDAVNLAARLEQAAPENEIYLGEETYRLVRDAVQVEAVEPLELKGKSERIPAWRLVSAEGLDGYVRRHDVPLVGRDAELAAIDQALAEVRGQRAVRLVTIVGDAGIGKSRLAYEVMARAGPGSRMLRGRCLPYGDGITFWPLREMASAAADVRPDDTPEEALDKMVEAFGDVDVADRLAAAAGLSAATFPLHELFWAARKFFEHMAGDGPLVALFDDIHWAEQAFLELIENVLDTSQGAPILLLATSRHDLLEERPDWGERPSALRLVLRPLSADAAGDVTRNLFGAAGLPDDIVVRIVEAAEGNPLYLEQMLSMLVDAGTLRLADGRWVRADGGGDIVIPPTIKALIEARLGRLGREERSTIDPASVIGLEFPAPAVLSLAPEAVRPGIDQHLGSLSRKRLVVTSTSADGEPIYRFHHHLVRDTVYGGLLKRARATLHVSFVRWADEINAERGRALEFQEILGYHLEQAYRYLGELGPLDDAGRAIGRDAALRLSAAARRSFARGDKHAAFNLFTRAIALAAVDEALRLTLLPDMGEVLLELGRFDEARSVLAEAVEQGERAANTRVVAAARLNRLVVWLHSGEPGNWSEAALEVTAQLIPQLEPLAAHAELARAWRLTAMAYQVAGKMTAAGESMPKLIKYAQLSGDERMVARSALGLALSVLYGPTPVPSAIAQCERLLADGLSDRQVVALVMGKLAQLQAMAGDFEAARASYNHARATLDDLGHGMHAASSSMDLAVIELLAGHGAAAERELRRDYAALEAMGETYYLSTMASLLARAVRDQGRDAEALELTKTAESIAADDDVDAQVLWRSTRAPILARGGAIDEAEALARAALELARQTDFIMLRAESLAELAVVLRIGRRDGAREALEEAIAVYAAKGDAVSTARLTELLQDA